MPPRYITSLSYGFTGYLSGSNTYEVSIALNGLSYPGSSTTVSPGTSFVGPGYGTMVPNNVALNSLQANGFSTLATLYQQYRVRASTIKATVVPYYPSIGPAIVTVVPCNTYQSNTDGQAAQTRPYAKSRLCCNQQNAKDCTQYSKMDVKTLYGLTEAQFQADNNLIAFTGSNPPKQALWTVFIDQIYDNSTVCGFSCEFNVVYEVEFWNPLNLKNNT